LLCQGSQIIAYQVNSVSDATSYEWSVTPSSAGTIIGTDTSVTLDWNSTFSGNAMIKVRGLNGTCSGDWSADLSIDVTPYLLIPTKPIGDTVMCVNSINSIYYTNSVSNSNIYLWQIIPAIAGTINSTDTTATVDWNNSWVGIAKIIVSAQNSCGIGPNSDTLKVLINDIPALMSIPIGITDVCQSVISTNCTNTPNVNATSNEWVLNPVAAGSISTISATGSQITWTTGWAGTAYVSVRGINSCGAGEWSDSLIIVRHPNVPTPTITQTGSTLHSSATTGNQWYFNGGILNGQTNQTYTYTQNGSYSVLVTDQYGCTATSAAFVVNNVGISVYGNNSTIVIAPNPNHGQFTIAIPQLEQENGELEIYNTLGMIVYRQKLTRSEEKVALNLQLPTGVYYLKIANNKSQFQKLVIE
jgi:hypothetical protein